MRGRKNLVYVGRVGKVDIAAFHGDIFPVCANCTFAVGDDGEFEPIQMHVFIDHRAFLAKHTPDLHKGNVSKRQGVVHIRIV